MSADRSTAAPVFKNPDIWQVTASERGDCPEIRTDSAATSDPCACKGWRGLWRVLLWGVPHVFCDGCNREVRDA